MDTRVLVFGSQADATAAAVAVTKVAIPAGGDTLLIASPRQLVDARWFLPMWAVSNFLSSITQAYSLAEVGLAAVNEQTVSASGVAGPPRAFSAADVASWLGFTPYSTANPSSFQTPDQVAAAAVAMMKPKLGAITASGHTQTPVSVTTGPIAVGGTTLTVSGVTDPVSGVQPGVGAMVFFKPSGTSDFPANILVSAVCTAPGVVSIRAMPIGGLALGTTTLVGNIFWIW